MTCILPVLGHTYHSFTSEMASFLGSGKIHAGIIYKQWMKKGRLCREDPAFTTAAVLFDRISTSTDFSVPLLVRQREDQEAVKFLLRTHDGFDIESVFLPMKNHNTLCVSSQVGCRMGCSFCETGRMGLLRNLTPEEIVSQVYIARFGLNMNIRNIVFMGMGEPFDNYDAVMQAVKVLTDQNGLAFGMNNITVSTSGKVCGIHKLMNEKELSVNLAVSLTSAKVDTRSRLMPITKKHSLDELYQAMEGYCSKTKKQILVACALMKGVNDGIDDADSLVDFLQGLDVKVNLIPYNPQRVDRYACPDWSTIEAYAARLRDRGLRVLLRHTKGRSSMAACGQLGVKNSPFAPRCVR